MSYFNFFRFVLIVQTFLFFASCSNTQHSFEQPIEDNFIRSAIISSATRNLSIEYQEKANTTLSGDEKKIIQTIAETTYSEVKELLPTLTDELTIEIHVDSVYQANGNSGYAMSPTKIRWIVDPAKGSISDIVRSGMRHTLYHEMHHLVRGWTVEGAKPKISFMDGVIAEGLAVAFERDFAGSTPPTADYPENVSDWVDELKVLPIDADYRKWMYFNPDGYRQLIGYRAGTYLIDQAMVASGETSVTLVNVPTETILRLAGIE